MLYHLNVFLHLLAAMLWLGGTFFLALVGAPVLRAIEPPELRQRLFHVLGERFRAVGWVAIAVLLVTGTLNLWYRGWLTWALFRSNLFWSTRTGHALAVKLICVALLVIGSAVHDFILGPKAGRVPAGSPEALRYRRQAAWLARFNAVVGLVLVGAAVWIVR